MQFEPEEIDRRFTHHPPTADQAKKYEDLREGARLYAHEIEQMCPDSREKALALTHLEQVVMYANAAIARRS